MTRPESGERTAGDRLYAKGARVQYSESTEFWRHDGLSRRERRRLAERLLRQGRINARTARQISEGTDSV